MGFFYFSVFSVVPLTIAYGALALLYWGLVRGTRGMRARWAVLGIAAGVFAVLPIAEELWIAWHFGQACKEAGTVIHKKVQVEGFYDETRTTHSGPPTAQAIESFEQSGYRFFEMKGREKFVRIEKIDGVWRPTVLDSPAARYHYRSRDHIPQALKVVKHESVVVDTQGEQIIGRETIFGRYAPWFFIGLDAPQMQCRGSREVKGLIHQSALLPK